MLRARLEVDVEIMHRLFLEMGVCTQEMLRDAVDALERQDMDLVASVLRRDDEVDALEREIENKALLLLTVRTPIASSDLRTVTTALKVISDLERIGDNAVNIAKTARRMWSDKVIYRPLFDVPRFHQIASRMLHQTLDVYVQQDKNGAEMVIEADDEADVFYKEIQRNLRDVIGRRVEEDNSATVNDAIAASYLLFVAHYFERICDHCVSIAERVMESETPTLD